MHPATRTRHATGELGRVAAILSCCDVLTVSWAARVAFGGLEGKVDAAPEVLCALEPLLRATGGGQLDRLAHILQPVNAVRSEQRRNLGDGVLLLLRAHLGLAAVCGLKFVVLHNVGVLASGTLLAAYGGTTTTQVACLAAAFPTL